MAPPPPWPPSLRKQPARAARPALATPPATQRMLPPLQHTHTVSFIAPLHPSLSPQHLPPSPPATPANPDTPAVRSCSQRATPPVPCERDPDACRPALFMAHLSASAHTNEPCLPHCPCARPAPPRGAPRPAAPAPSSFANALFGPQHCLRYPAPPAEVFFRLPSLAKPRTMRALTSACPVPLYSSAPCGSCPGNAASAACHLSSQALQAALLGGVVHGQRGEQRSGGCDTAARAASRRCRAQSTEQSAATPRSTHLAGGWSVRSCSVST